MLKPPWLEIAENELGTSEVKGGKNNNRIVQYHASTKLKASTDEVPWCSSFVNWVMQTTGIPGTKMANARSWLTWGVGLNLKNPAYGCVVVLSRGKNPRQGHVGFYLGKGPDGKIHVLGGNQGNKVSVAAFKKELVLGYRWPK